MAFSVDEKTRMLYFLGYSIFEDDGPAVRAINGLDSKEAAGGTILRSLLRDLERVDCEIMETLTLAAAIKDGSIEIRAHYTLAHLRQVGRQLVNRLARFTKVAIAGDLFSASSDARDPGSFYSQDPSEHRIDSNKGVPTY